MLTAERPEAYGVHDGLAVYRFRSGEPVFLMPGPHRFQKPGDRTADALIAGLTHLGRQVITFDPPGAGQSTRAARLGMAEMHQCANEALDVCRVSGPVDALGHSMGGLGDLLRAQRPLPVHRGGRSFLGCRLWLFEGFCQSFLS
jgi:pimeloyl-ACP methyl ester carboxylesterase